MRASATPREKARNSSQEGNSLKLKEERLIKDTTRNKLTFTSTTPTSLGHLQSEPSQAEGSVLEGSVLEGFAQESQTRFNDCPSQGGRKASSFSTNRLTDSKKGIRNDKNRPNSGSRSKIFY